MENKDSCVVNIGNTALEAISGLQDGNTIDIMIDTLNDCEDNYFALRYLQDMSFDTNRAFQHLCTLRDLKKLLLNLKPENQ